VPSTSVVLINPKEAIADKLSAVFHIQRLSTAIPGGLGPRNPHALPFLRPSKIDVKTKFVNNMFIDTQTLLPDAFLTRIVPCFLVLVRFVIPLKPRGSL